MNVFLGIYFLKTWEEEFLRLKYYLEKLTDLLDVCISYRSGVVKDI